MPELSAYERGEAAKIVEHRRAEAARPTSRARQAVERAGKRVTSGVRKVPGVDQTLALAAAGYEQAVKGMAKAMTTSARLSLSEKALLRRYARHDSAIATIADIRRLDLEVIDEVRPHGLTHRYALGAGAEGAAGGLLMGGGAAIATLGGIFGAGAGAAPGIGVAAGVFAADTATVLVSTTRLCLQVGSYYGYDPHDEREELFAAGVINLSTVGGAAAKNAAYADLFRLANMLARKATWDQLNKAVLTHILQPVFQRLSLRLVKVKLGQIVPVAGMVVGAGMNYAMLDRVGTAAHWAYRERFLRDKGYPFETFAPAPDDGAPEQDDDEPMSIVQIVNEALGDPEGDEPTS